MAGSTQFFQLAFFDFGDKLNSAISNSMQIDRFFTIDKQLYGIYSIFGDGVISGWNVFYNGYSIQNGISLGITTGLGIIGLLAMQSTSGTVLSSVPPGSNVGVYAIAGAGNFINRGVSFIASTTVPQGSFLQLASVVTGTNTVISIDNTARTYSNLTEGLQAQIQNHRHRGSLISPSKIDLKNEVKGKLSSANIAGIDASKITSGKLDPSTLPALDHGDLKGIGNLTHAQIDTYIAGLTGSNDVLLGQIFNANRMRSNVFAMFSDSNSTKWMLNQIDYVPGVSGSNVVDAVNTTAVIDTSINSIVGPDVSSAQTYWFSKLYSLPSPVVGLIMTSVKNQNSGVQFGVNFGSSANFIRYSIVPQNELVTFNSNTSNSFKIGIKMSSNLLFQYPSMIDSIFASHNVIQGIFTPPANSTYRFVTKIYSDPDFTNLVYQSDSTVLPDQWSINHVAPSVSGNNLIASSNYVIIYTPLSSAIVSQTQYYVKQFYVDMVYPVIPLQVPIVVSPILIKHRDASFFSDIQYSFNNTLATDNFHFRIRFYSDKARTNLVHTADSSLDTTGWTVNFGSPITPSGVNVISGSTVVADYVVDPGLFTLNDTLYLAMDAKKINSPNAGYATQSQTDMYSFQNIYLPNTAGSYNGRTQIKGFGMQLQLANGQLVLLNS